MLTARTDVTLDHSMIEQTLHLIAQRLQPLAVVGLPQHRTFVQANRNVAVKHWQNSMMQ
jgi:hypothetical protein